MYILPNPQKIDMHKGRFTVRYNSRIYIDSSCSADLYHIALLLQKEFKECCGFCLPIVKSHITQPESCIYLTSLDNAKEQSYHLYINENSVIIQGAGNAGILYGLLKGLPSSAKDVVNAYLIAGEGQKLLNRLLPVLYRHLNGVPETDPSCPAELAEELEIWLVSYRALWKTVSRESEFYRIANVYYWYADYLRGFSASTADFTDLLSLG